MTAPIDAVATYARSRPSALACVDLDRDRRWTYAELHRQVDRTAGWLVEKLGPRSGARVASLGRNSGAALVLHLAAIRAGAIFAPFNWRLAAPELAAIVADAQPSIIIHDPEFGVADFQGVQLTFDAMQTLVAAGAPSHPPVAARRSADEAGTLLYTSGTSGTPKGVIVTEANAYWGATNFILAHDVAPSSVFLCDMPMFHTAGLFAAIRSPLIAGAAVLISRGFEPARTLARIGDATLGITHYFSVPQMAQQLWQQPGFEPAMLRGLTVYATGGAPNPPAQIERFVRAGIRMSDGFGMSESGSSFAMPFHDPQLLLDKAGSCGLPLISLQARVVDDVGDEVGDGVRGELWIRGPSVTPGYWNRPRQTVEAFSGGWLKTGDTAMRDHDGFYFLIDRIKDMYISGGENVYPAEVEAAVAVLDAVAEVAVVGIPDDKWGEVGRAYIIVAPGRSLSAQTVIEHCRTRLARFKTPASVVFTDQIPRTASGKVQKHLLKLRALREALEEPS